MVFNQNNDDFEYFYLPLTNGGGTVIDWSDMPLALCFNWYASTNAYVTTSIYLGSKSKPNQKMIKLHRLLMGFPKNLVVDHINGKKLDNRCSCNLRGVTQSINNTNIRRRSKMCV